MVSIHRRKGVQYMDDDEKAMDCEAHEDADIPKIVRISQELLQQKADGADTMYESCVSCGRRCLDNRAAGKLGKCNTGIKCMVSSHFAHFGEELCLRGTKGSGTIFFTNCNLKCIYCQNYDISQDGNGYDVEDEEMAEMMMDLQRQGCHNINFVSPTHVVAPVLRALVIAKKRGLNLPIVYNTGGYDSPETLALFDGVVDIYMPDMKYSNSKLGKRFSKIDNYPEVNMAAVKEMHRQVGDLVLDPHTGLAKRGLLIRHLVLPTDQAGTELIAEFVAKEIGPNAFVDVMAQYYPEHKAIGHKALGREITPEELLRAVKCFTDRGLHRLNHHFDERKGCMGEDKLAVLVQRDMDW